ncbi:hypothetical protein Tco_0191191 [Tanacetum coccineum]
MPTKRRTRAFGFDLFGQTLGSFQPMANFFIGQIYVNFGTFLFGGLKSSMLDQTLNPSCINNAINARRLPLAPFVYTLVRPSMTTIVVNNSVFRAFFEKQRLTRPNFIDWYRNLRIVLSVEDKLPFLEHPIHAMPIPPAGQVLPPDVLATHAAWVKASKEIAGLVLMTMEPDIQKNLEQLGAYDMLKELKMLFAQ